MTANNSSQKQWHTLSPLSIIYFVIHFIVRFVKDGLLNMAPAFVIFLTQVEDKLYWGIVAAAGLSVLLIVYAVLYYLNFRYKLTDHEVILRKGVFKKERVTLNFAKIQNINLAIPFYFQPFQLVKCTFDAAGSAQQEVALPGIKSQLAQVMRQNVFSYKESHTTANMPTADDEQNTVSEKPILTLTNKEVAKFGLMSGMMFLVLAAIAPFIEHVVDYSKDQFVGPLAAFYGGFIDSQDVAMIVAAVSVVAAMVFLFVAASVLGAFLRFYNFELYFENEKLKRISGLLERHQMSLSKSKIQTVEIKKNWVGMLLNRYIVSCKQVENGHCGKAKKGQAFILPVLTYAQLMNAMTLCWQTVDLKRIAFTPISGAFWRKNWALFCVLPSTIVVGFVYNTSGVFAWPLWLAVLIVTAFMCWLRCKRYGIYSDGEQVFVRTGFVGKTVSVFYIHKIQKISYTQTPLMKRAKLVTLTIQLASGRVRVPYLPEALVLPMVDEALYKAESSNLGWL